MQAELTRAERDALFVPELHPPAWITRGFFRFWDGTTNYEHRGLPSDCLVWKKPGSGHQPPRMFLEGRELTVWDYAWRLHYAKLPVGWIPRARAACHTPLCVQPDHLEPRRRAGRFAPITLETAERLWRARQPLRYGLPRATVLQLARQHGFSERTIYRVLGEYKDHHAPPA